MNTKLIRLLWVCLLVMAAPGVWAQNQVDIVPDQCVSGTMLVCRCGETGEYVEYAETKFGHFFYRSTIGGHSEKAGFVDDIFVRDIIYDNGMIYFGGYNLLGQGVIGRFGVNSLFGGVSGYEYATLASVGVGDDCGVTSVNKLASYIDNGERYVAFVGDMRMLGNDVPNTTVGCATCTGGNWDVHCVYNKSAQEGYEDVAVTDGHVVTVGHRRDSAGYHVLVWKRVGMFLNHYRSGSRVSGTVTQKPHIAVIASEKVAVATHNGQQGTNTIDLADVSSGYYSMCSYGNNNWHAHSLQEMVYSPSEDRLVVQGKDSLYSLQPVTLSIRGRSGCSQFTMQDIVDAAQGNLSIVVGALDADMYLCRNVNNIGEGGAPCHVWWPLVCTTVQHEEIGKVYPDGVMHCGVENESVYPIINTVHHILNCSD